MTLRTGRIGHAALIAFATLLALMPSGLRAQSADPAFVVAVPDRYPADEGVGFIVRGGDGRQKDVIIMNGAALDASTLAAAVTLLNQLRLKAPVPSSALEVTTVQGLAPLRDAALRTVPALDRALSALREAPRVRIGNVGPGRWLELRPDVLR